jgi:hypothetical protein
MPFNHHYKRLILLVLCFSTFSSLSDDNKTNLQIEMVIKPIACVVKKAGDECSMTINVNWQSPLPIDSCLFQSKKELSCWKATKQASQRINILLSKEMIFTLKSNKGETYAQQSIQVNTSMPKIYRRRLRSEWSLF